MINFQSTYITHHVSLIHLKSMIASQAFLIYLYAKIGSSDVFSWCESHSVMSNSLQPHGLYSPWNSPGQNTWVGRLSLLQGIFPAQGLIPAFLHCRWILYQLSHKGSLRILEWVAYPFSSRSSQPRNWTRISCIASRFFTNWAIRENPFSWWDWVIYLTFIF